MNRRFQAKCVKNSNFHIFKTTASIATKFCTVIKTTKYPLWVSKCVPNKFKMADGCHLDKPYSGIMCHVVAGVRIAASAAAIISLWRQRHPISVGFGTAATHTALVMPVWPTVTAASSRWVDSGSRQTLLVLQSVIEFANIWAQYSPWTYASTHVSFFDFYPNVQTAAV